MWEEKHLTAIPKATVDKNGYEVIDVGNHRRGIVEELEKAHIYIEELNNNIKKLEDEYKNNIKKLEERIAQLEKIIENQQ